MILTILAIIIALVVSIIPALIVGYGAARLIHIHDPDAINLAAGVFSLLFAATYVASAYALIAWGV